MWKDFFFLLLFLFVGFVVLGLYHVWDCYLWFLSGKEWILVVGLQIWVESLML